jgi:mono/diheme cytochrome c family protein
MRIPGVLAAAVAVVLWGGAARAAESQQDVSRTMYVKYCGACHGPAGKGDGIAGTFMRPKPADLTQIAKKNGGKFSFEATMHVIDGTDTPRAHGDPDMPVWGEVLREQSAAPDRRADVKQKLMQITDYLRSIQEK